MEKDLTEVHNLWQKIRDYNTFHDYYKLEEETHEFKLNIICFLQKELCEKSRHFFLKKADNIFTLRPLKPEELTSLYLNAFKDTYPFSKEALKHIASQCGGTPRRFKKMLEQCLNNYHRQGNLNAQISPEDVSKWISPELFSSDRELEFADAFPHSKLHLARKAATVVTFLEQQPDWVQQEFITEKYFAGDFQACSKFLVKLEKQTDYIESKFKNRKKIIRIKKSPSILT